MKEQPEHFITALRQPGKILIILCLFQKPFRHAFRFTDDGKIPQIFFIVLYFNILCIAVQQFSCKLVIRKAFR